MINKRSHFAGGIKWNEFVIITAQSFVVMLTPTEAQQPKLYRVGYVTAESATSSVKNLDFPSAGALSLWRG